MRATRNSTWQAWGAGLAAYLVAFQLVFAGLAPPGHAAPGSRGADGGSLGQVICDHALGVPDGSERRDAPKPCAECCLFGCTLGTLFVPPAAADLPAYDVGTQAVVVGPSIDTPDVPRQYSPRTTRGPPGSA